MFTHPVSADFATDLHADGHIANYATHMAGTDDEVTVLMSHSGQVADMIDDEGVTISYSIYKDVEAREYGEYDHIGAIADDADRAEFLNLFK